MLHFYILLGLIPACTVAFLANVLIGPATLAEIPEGYVPKQYEYHKHPISRFILKYIVPSHQEVYERNLHYHFVEDEKRRMRLMAWKVEALMRERGDYPNYFVNNSVLSKYLRKMMWSDERMKDESGND
jgi:NADH dehydrogenase (ubiquinone) 1 beta subcomplex subunit 5